MTVAAIPARDARRETGVPKVPAGIKARAASDAARLLDMTWPNGGGAPPVDPFRIADKLGIDVRPVTLPAHISAALVKEHGQDPQIALNAADHVNRQRFSCAHELGHFVGRRGDQDVYEYIDFRDIFAAPGDGPEEIYANEFAACLLMPERDVRMLHRQGWTEVDLPVRFGVSRDAVHFRLKNLGLV